MGDAKLSMGAYFSRDFSRDANFSRNAKPRKYGKQI